MGQELSRQLGWGSTGINLAPLGTTAAQMAALKTRQIDGMIVEVNAGFRMEEDGSGRIVVQFGERIKVFHIYVVYARKAFLEKNPDAVRAFLAGWFDSVAYMRAQRAQTIEIVRRTAEVSQGIATRDYDELMGMFNSSGKFNPKALEVLGRSFVEMGSLPQVPDMRALITERYLPAPRDQGNDCGPLSPRIERTEIVAPSVDSKPHRQSIAAGVPGGSARGSTSITPSCSRTR